MRLGGWLALLLALWAGAAAAQPVIVDPDPDDDEVDWQLSLEHVLSGLSAPVGFVFVGTKEDEAMLVLEKNGRVRRFVNRLPVLPDAFDLPVDNCGERGAMGIALHTRFGESPPPTDPPPPNRVYLSYHTDAGRTDDGCDGDAILRVERYAWNGTTLVKDLEPAPGPADNTRFTPYELAVNATSQLGGLIASTTEFRLTEPIGAQDLLYILIGSLGRQGTLQNNRDVQPPVLDDTSVMLRLTAEGGLPVDNPLDDPQVDEVQTQDRYHSYGVHDPRGIARDPVGGSIWFTDEGDPAAPPAADRPDEINLFFGASNGGYSDYQGFQDGRNIPKNDEPTYTLVDLAKTITDDPADSEPISTYLNPRFSFEVPTIKPTGIAFGGAEVGPQHREDAFVGTEDGKLLRFKVEPFRNGFLLLGPLGDTIAQDANPSADPPREADSLETVLIAQGFGAISDLEAGVDGSMYVMDGANGSIYRVFFDAVRDLGILSVKAPTKISLSTKKPSVSKRIKVVLVNNGETPERIDDQAELDGLLGVSITPFGGSSCTPLVGTGVEPWYGFPIGVAPGDKLPLQVEVAWTCATPTAGGVPDYATTFSLNDAAIGIDDQDPSNDTCPRPPAGGDPGCGAKGGANLLTDVIQK